MILRLENEMSMLEAKERALIDEDEDFLNDNVHQVELCEDKIPQFESIFKDPNDFPYLSSLTKIEDDKIPSNEKISLKEILVEKITVLQNKISKIKSNEKPQKEKTRKSEHSTGCSSKTSGKFKKLLRNHQSRKVNSIQF